MSDLPAFVPDFVEVRGRRVGLCQASCPHFDIYVPFPSLSRCIAPGGKPRETRRGEVCMPWMVFALGQKDASLAIAQTQCGRFQQARDSARALALRAIDERDRVRDEARQLRIELSQASEPRTGGSLWTGGTATEVPELQDVSKVDPAVFAAVAAEVAAELADAEPDELQRAFSTPVTGETMQTWIPNQTRPRPCEDCQRIRRFYRAGGAGELGPGVDALVELADSHARATGHDALQGLKP